MTMTPERFKECVDTIGWTGHGLAAILGVHETRTRRWGTGRYPVPQNVADWLERLAAFHEKHPFPKGWEQPKGDEP